MQITNGTVERVYKPGDYENRRVALSFNIDPGEDINAILAHVAAMAEHHARTQPAAPLHMQAIANGPNLDYVPSPPPLLATTAVAPPATRTRRAVAPAAASPPAALPAAPQAPVAEVAPSPDPFAPVLPVVAPAAPVTSAAPAPGASQPASPVGLTDEDLRGAITRKVDASQDRQGITNKVRALVLEFTQNPVAPIYSVTDPAARSAFLQKLAALV